jgi:hypothetical protein
MEPSAKIELIKKGQMGLSLDHIERKKIINSKPNNTDTDKTHDTVGKEHHQCSFCNASLRIQITLEKHMRICIHPTQI